MLLEAVCRTSSANTSRRFTWVRMIGHPRSTLPNSVSAPPGPTCVSNTVCSAQHDGERHASTGAGRTVAVEPGIQVSGRNDQ